MRFGSNLSIGRTCAKADNMFQYYVSTGIENNSLLGTSAFVLACIEMALLEESY